jgi:hypothetical protein
MMIEVSPALAPRSLATSAASSMLHAPSIGIYIGMSSMSIFLVVTPTLLALTDYILVQKIMQVSQVA